MYELKLGLAVFAITLCVTVLTSVTVHAQWAPAENTLMTPWAADVSPDKVLPEYPRPQMTRDAWQNLNGLWDYAIRPRHDAKPASFDGKILVPFAVESALSGVKKPVGEDNVLWYRRTFEVPADWTGKRVLLQFGAVDWRASVCINGVKVGCHRGGYDPFSFDITHALKDSGPQEIVVRVWDPSDAGTQPRGKQVNDPKGIWYTSVTGIWQTVWIEPVDASHVDALKLVPDIDAKKLDVTVKATGPAKQVKLTAMSGNVAVATATGTAGQPIALSIPNPKLWSPDSPYLYDLVVELMDGGATVDRVESYFGMRKVSLQKDEDGINRLFLNNEPLFHFGPLDQGWWPDGLYTAPTDAALRYDVEMTRKFGFNMARKHVKVEPARWYYHCDQLGLMVWQDMPSGDHYIRGDEPDFDRSAQSEDQYYREWGAIMDAFGTHPSIVMWVPFNEGWGQFDTNVVTGWTKQRDPSRLVNQASGWTDRGGSDVYDKHAYPGPAMFPVQEKRASVLGEFGGLGWPVPDHLWWDKRNWGYRTYQSQEELRSHYEQLIVALRPLIGEGLAAAVYTQTTDVEGEVNGLMTYDRKVDKMETDWLAPLNNKVYLEPPVFNDVVPTSKKEAQVWRYTTDTASPGWREPGFDDSAWQQGPGAFGKKDMPNTTVRTEWTTDRIWLRRTFTWPADADGPVYLRIYHDEDADVYINGVPAAKLSRYSGDYTFCPIREEARKTIKPGENLLAIVCKQTDGGQCIDAGITVEE